MQAEIGDVREGPRTEDGGAEQAIGVEGWAWRWGGESVWQEGEREAGLGPRLSSEK